MDVIVVVRGPIGVNAGAGDLVGRHLADARTIEVQACGSHAEDFAEELRTAARLQYEQCNPWDHA